MTGLLFCATILTTNVVAGELYELEDVLSYNEEYFYDDCYYGTVFTPKGNAITVMSYINDYTISEKESIKNDLLLQYPNSVFLSSATTRYNCHSYAWYSQNTSTNIWNMLSPEQYILDGSCFETDGEIGDIVLYYNVDEPIHSGIVVDTISGNPDQTWNGLNLKVIESKWGHGPLFRHNGVECPYTEDYIINNDPECLIIKYFRLHPEHSYTNSFVNFKNNKHKAFCECGDWRLENHVVSGIDPIYGTATCIYCFAVVDTGFVQYDFLSEKFVLLNNMYYPLDTIVQSDITYLSFDDSSLLVMEDVYEK